MAESFVRTNKIIWDSFTAENEMVQLDVLIENNTTDIAKATLQDFFIKAENDEAIKASLEGIFELVQAQTLSDNGFAESVIGQQLKQLGFEATIITLKLVDIVSDFKLKYSMRILFDKTN